MGNSYSSDQTTLNLATIGADTLSRLGELDRDWETK